MLWALSLGVGFAWALRNVDLGAIVFMGCWIGGFVALGLFPFVLSIELFTEVVDAGSEVRLRDSGKLLWGVPLEVGESVIHKDSLPVLVKSGTFGQACVVDRKGVTVAQTLNRQTAEAIAVAVNALNGEDAVDAYLRDCL